MKRKIVIVLLLVCSIVLNMGTRVCVFAAEDEEALLPEGGKWPTGPEIKADGAIVIEQSTGLILYAKDIYTAYYPASTTKTLTTLLALENSELNETVDVSYEAEWYVSKASSRIGLVEGEQLTMEEALYGIMLESANEATYAVGEHVAGSIAKFIKMMNNKAKELGCVNSHFANSHGLHDDEHYTCCYDLSLIAQAAFNHETFRKITGTCTYVMPPTNKNPERVMTNHHKFINKEYKYDYCVGGKTGSTPQAGYALVTYAKKDGMTLTCVVMHDDCWDSVYNDTRTLLDFAFANYDIHDMSEADGERVEVFPSLFGDVQKFSKNSESNLRLGNEGKIILPNGVSLGEVSKEVNLYKDVVIEHGDNVIGDVSYTYDNRVVGKADICYYNEEYPLTDKSFAQRWPVYMKPVEVVYGENSGSSIPVYSVRMETVREAREVVDPIPVLISIGAGIVILVVGVIILKKKLSQ